MPLPNIYGLSRALHKILICKFNLLFTDERTAPYKTSVFFSKRAYKNERKGIVKVGRKTLRN